MDASTRIESVENANSFIQQFEYAIGTSLVSYYNQLHDGSKRWKSHTETDIFDEFFERPPDRHIDSRLICMDPRYNIVVNEYLGPDVARFSTELNRFITSYERPPSCGCIHCYLRAMFNKNRVVRILQAFQAVLSDRQPRSFDISPEEYNAIQNDSLRAAIYLVDVVNDSFYMSEKRIRLWLNGVDVFFIQVVLDKSTHL